MDNLKKKKQDGKRISLTQPHERAYLKRSSLEMKRLLEIDKRRKLKHHGEVMLYRKKGPDCKVIRTDKLIRICKALLKFLRR